MNGCSRAIDQQVSSALWKLQLSNPVLIKRTHFGITSSPGGPRPRAECIVPFMFDALRVRRRAAGCILNWDAMLRSSFQHSRQRHLVMDWPKIEVRFES